MPDLVRSTLARDGTRMRIVLDNPTGNIITAALASAARAALEVLDSISRCVS